MAPATGHSGFTQAKAMRENPSPPAPFKRSPSMLASTEYRRLASLVRSIVALEWSFEKSSQPPPCLSPPPQSPPRRRPARAPGSSGRRRRRRRARADIRASPQQARSRHGEGGGGLVRAARGRHPRGRVPPPLPPSAARRRSRAGGARGRRGAVGGAAAAAGRPAPGEHRGSSLIRRAITHTGVRRLCRSGAHAISPMRAAFR
jgi:hypothetical protein